MFSLRDARKLLLQYASRTLASLGIMLDSSSVRLIWSVAFTLGAGPGANCLCFFQHATVFDTSPVKVTAARAKVWIWIW